MIPHYAVRISRLLTLTNVAPAIAGAYFAGVTNAEGSATSATVNLTVLGPNLTNPFSVGEVFRFSLPTGSGLNYRVEYKSHLGEAQWNVLTNFTGTGGIVIFSDDMRSGASRFYRVSVQ